jgi:hypothetical protein
MGFAIINLLGLLTHPIFIFFMVACNAIVLFRSRHEFCIVSVCNLSTMGLFLILWGPFLFYSIGLPATRWMEVPDLRDLLQGYLNLWGDGPTLFLAGFIVVASVWNRRAARGFLLSPLGLVVGGMLMVSSLLPFLVSQYKPVYIDFRTPSLFFPTACVVVALLIARFRPFWLTLVVLVSILVIAVIGPLAEMAQPPSEQSPRSSIEYVLGNAKRGDVLISGGLAVNEVTYYMRRRNTPSGIQHAVFPQSMIEHPGWMDPASLLANSGELAREAKALVKRVNERLEGHNRIWFFYEIDSPRQVILDILKRQLDQEMVLIRTEERSGSFFDAVAIYAAKKRSSLDTRGNLSDRDECPHQDKVVSDRGHAAGLPVYAHTSSGDEASSRRNAFGPSRAPRSPAAQLHLGQL